MMDEGTIYPGAEKVGWCGRNLTSRILEGVMARRGLVEPREGSWSGQLLHGMRSCRLLLNFAHVSVVYSGHLPVVPGDRDGIPTRFSDNAAVSVARYLFSKPRNSN